MFLSPCPKLALSFEASKLIHLQSNLSRGAMNGDAGLNEPRELVNDMLPSRSGYGYKIIIN